MMGTRNTKRTTYVAPRVECVQMTFTGFLLRVSGNGDVMAGYGGVDEDGSIDPSARQLGNGFDDDF